MRAYQVAVRLVLIDDPEVFVLYADALADIFEYGLQLVFLVVQGQFGLPLKLLGTPVPYRLLDRVDDLRVICKSCMSFVK